MPFHSNTIDRATLRIGTLTLTILDASLFIASRAVQGSRWLGGIRCCQIQGEILCGSSLRTRSQSCRPAYSAIKTKWLLNFVHEAVSVGYVANGVWFSSKVCCLTLSVCLSGVLGLRLCHFLLSEQCVCFCSLLQCPQQLSSGLLAS